MSTFDIPDYKHIRVEAYLAPKKKRADRLAASERSWLWVIGFIVMVLLTLATWHPARATELTDTSVYSASDVVQERTYCFEIKEGLATASNSPGTSAITNFCARYGI